ncbi:MAG: retroviral-like aspartic protease family protein [Zoogloeaceae bacterium]|jgi:aspartyl protease family protein|nr:retroviral-like aspartic protease family protein [Zoogloeaceae bacterium]
MIARRVKQGSPGFTAGATFGLLAMAAQAVVAAEAGLAGIFGGKALLVINGAAPRLMTVNQEYAGVKLVAVSDTGAQVKMNGKRIVLRVGQNVLGGVVSEKGESVTLTPDRYGMFRIDGKINDNPVRFTVDTGATWIMMAPSEARRLGVSLADAETVGITTANGKVLAPKVLLKSVSVGHTTLRDIEAVVVLREMPDIYLGMSALEHFNILLEGGIFTLRRR